MATMAATPMSQLLRALYSTILINGWIAKMLADIMPMALMALMFNSSAKLPKNRMVQTSVNGVNALVVRQKNRVTKETRQMMASNHFVGCHRVLAASIPSRNGAPQPMQFCLNHHIVSSLV